MVYVDTNVLIYTRVDQGTSRRTQAIELIESLCQEGTLMISQLTLQELVFSLAKLKVELSLIDQDIAFYRQFIQYPIELTIFDTAYQLAAQANRMTSFNDALHLAYAQKYAKKLVTFDKDFIAFQRVSNFPIQVIA